MTICVMCCGCQRFLKADGSLQAMTGGLVTVSGREIRTSAGDSESDGLAYFPDAKSADARCLALGWQVADSTGPNHRCPECVRAELKASRADKPRGAHVRFDGGQPMEILSLTPCHEWPAEPDPFPGEEDDTVKITGTH